MRLAIAALALLVSLSRLHAVEPLQDFLTPAAPISLEECLLANGLGYSPFRDGQSPDGGIPVDVAQVEDDLRFLSHVTKHVRIYSTEGALAAAPALAPSLGLHVVQGVHLDGDQVRNEQHIAAALALARAGLIASIVVGNEVLTSATLTKDELIRYLRKVRREAPASVPVTTAETWDKWVANPDLANDVDFVMAHFHPFWEDQPVEGAADAVFQRYVSLKALLDDKYPLRNLKLIIGETGWPSAGAPRVAGVEPGPLNQRRFAGEFLALACKASIPFYYFSAFDEEWKWREGASAEIVLRPLPLDRTFSNKWIGSSWGLFHANGTLKQPFSDIVVQPPHGTRLIREILVNGQLASYYDIGVDSSQQRRDWLSSEIDSLKMSYPQGQEWGAVFVTVGTPTDPPRPWKDFSVFTVLSLDLRAERDGEIVDVGIKDYAAPDDGSERKVRLVLSKDYRRYDLPLSLFASSRVVIPDDLKRLYVVAEFVFAGREPRTVYVKNIRYTPTE